MGTEIKVTFTAETTGEGEASNSDVELLKIYNNLNRPTVSLMGFEDPHRGTQLLRNVLSANLVSRWGLTLSENPHSGALVILNEDLSPVVRAIEDKNPHRYYIILSSARGDPKLMNVVNDFERIGGFCRVIYKPVGPGRLASALRLCFHAFNISRSSRTASAEDLGITQTLGPLYDPPLEYRDGLGGTSFLSLPRRYSEESGQLKKLPHLRPPLGPRAITVHPLASWSDLSSPSEQDEPNSLDESVRSLSPVLAQSPSSPTIAIGTGGTLLKSSTGTFEALGGPIRVLVVEDNAILRNLL